MADKGYRFMADKIMPMSEAVEGYELFDKMKVQKGTRTSYVCFQRLVLTSTRSCVRSTKVTADARSFLV